MHLRDMRHDAHQYLSLGSSRSSPMCLNPVVTLSAAHYPAVLLSCLTLALPIGHTLPSDGQELHIPALGLCLSPGGSQALTPSTHDQHVTHHPCTLLTPASVSLSTHSLSLSKP